MADAASTEGTRIRELFAEAKNAVMIVAPFVKVGALRSLVDVIPPNITGRCVTRWLPREIAAGVSDPEIVDVFAERGHFSIELVDRLHAKLYVADERCLVGSANVTRSGLGEGDSGGNIEILVPGSVTDPEVAAVLAVIDFEGRHVDRADALLARGLADSLPRAVLGEVATNWFPRSRRANDAFRCYLDIPTGFVKASEQMLLVDLAMFDLPPGLSEGEFTTAIRSQLASLPISQVLLDASEDRMLTRAEAQSFLERAASSDESTDDLWKSFLNWMSCFFPEQLMKQEVAEFALRRAVRLLED